MIRCGLVTLLGLCFLSLAVWGQEGSDARAAEFTRLIERLRPLHEKLGAAGPYDWLTMHPESEQGFAEYIASSPITPTRQRRIIYVQPIGEFSSTQERILLLTTKFLEDFFVLPVKLRRKIPLARIPSSARREHPAWGTSQVLSTFVLEEILMHELPRDAASYLGLTTADLWPGEGWNFVFGQASIEDRVGVWSIHRNGDPDQSEADFQLCLVRTIKTAAHEMGHMFSLLHCVNYQCLMNGSNYRAEADRRPLWLCAECLAKLAWACDFDVAARYKKLERFYRGIGLALEAEFCAQSLQALR